MQTGLTIALVAGLALAFGASGPRAVFYGFLVALSSTAVVLKLYADRHETECPHGKAVIGMLLFQDFLIVPMIVLTPVLAGSVQASPAAIAARLVGGFLVVGLVFAVARYLMPRLLYYLVRTRIREVFVLGALLVCLGMAFFTESLGFSLALGGFLAGIIVSESEYSHQVVAEVAPFRDVFTSVFFVSAGMLVDVAFAAAHWPVVLGLTVAVVVVKAVTGVAAGRALLYPPRTVVLVALGLAQLGEFSFVLLGVGRAQGIIDGPIYQTVIAVAVLTLVLAPALIGVAPWLAERVPRWLGAGSPAGAAAAVTPSRSGRHVVIVGFGLNGRTLARVLREAHISYAAVELNGDIVRRALAEGEPIVFGDSTRREILEHAGIHHAQVVVFGISDVAAVRRSIPLARRLNPDVHILVRTRSLAHIEELRRYGADEVIAEEFETAIEVFTRVLERFHVPRNIVRAQTRLLRGEGYRMLRAPSLRGEASEALLQALAAGTTEALRLESGSAAIGRSLRDIDLRRETGVTVLAVVRDGKPIPNPQAGLRLEQGDTLVLVGSHAEIDAAMALLDPPPPAPDAA